MVTTVSKEGFGTLKSGESVEKYVLKNENNVTVELLTYGAIIHRILVPDNKGNVDDVVTGYDDIQGYENDPAYMGAVVGRYANRIAGGKFTLDGMPYQLAINNGPNHLHGGVLGFSKRVWQASVGSSSVTMSLMSADGDQGYPGNLDVSVTYELTSRDELDMRLAGRTDKATPLNMTNHAYFNLAGQDKGDIYDQVLTIYADHYTPKDKHSIPTGEIRDVTNTVFDLREGATFGSRLPHVTDDLGYDHNWCVRGNMQPAARVVDPKSGRVLEVLTSAPGLQCYTANYFDMIGKGGTHYKKHGAFALETQNYPDAINKPNFPSAVLRPGEQYSHCTLFRFSAIS